MNPADLEALGLHDGDTVSLSAAGKRSASGPVKADEECPPGAVYVTRPFAFGGVGHRRPLLALFKLDENPVRVEVSPAAA